MSNSLDPDQARHFVGPDLGPNCLQKASAGKELNIALCTCDKYQNLRSCSIVHCTDSTCIYPSISNRIESANNLDPGQIVIKYISDQGLPNLSFNHNLHTSTGITKSHRVGSNQKR